MKKYISIILCLTLTTICLVGCGNQSASTNGDNLKMYLSLSQPDTFRNVLVNQAQQTASQYGATIDVYDAQNYVADDIDEQMAVVSE